MLFGVKANVGSNPTVTASENPRESGGFLHSQGPRGAFVVNGKAVLGRVKNHETHRGIPGLLGCRARGCVHGQRPGRPPVDLRGGRLPAAGQRRFGWFAGAVRRTEAGDSTFRRVTPHDLRHTAASLAISAGANVKVVQRMLGHKSAQVTLDTYAALLPDDLDNIVDALGQQRVAPLRDKRIGSSTLPIRKAGDKRGRRPQPQWACCLHRISIRPFDL